MHRGNGQLRGGKVCFCTAGYERGREHAREGVDEAISLVERGAPETAEDGEAVQLAETGRHLQAKAAYQQHLRAWGPASGASMYCPSRKKYPLAPP